MKHYAVLSIGLAFGLVVGMLVPREELQRLRRDNRRAHARLLHCEVGSDATSLASLLDVARPSPSNDRGTEGNRADGGVADAIASPDGPDGGATIDETAPASGNDSSARIDGGTPSRRASDHAELAAIDLRMHQARASLREQADLDDAQMAQLDTIVADMNRQIAGRLEEAVAAARARGGVLTRRAAMEVAADGLDILMLTDDRIRALVGRDVAATVDIEAIDPTSFFSSDAMRVVEGADDIRIEGR